jgi:hypothetical protein
VYGHYAVRHCDLHGKGAFAVRQPFAVRDSSFFNFFIYVLFFLLLMFISQLVLYFVDYLLVLLNTMSLHHNIIFPTDKLVVNTNFIDRKSVGNVYCRPT